MPLRPLPLLCLLAVLPERGDAHHSTAMYDPDELLDVSGIVARVEWTGPHAFIFVTAADGPDGTVEWGIELDPPVLLERLGWRESTVEAGDSITFTGAPAKSGAPTMRGLSAVLDDGTELAVWSSR